ncbi:hypothetical protein [Saccharothrix australiensis]|uniref:hypothetical protein n=1 Tax=Saccharothrix australiensis TaxID=2072 RepID=UPI0011C409D4|nr:hypothetical protein [Saccharothrix australiensis]
MVVIAVVDVGGGGSSVVGCVVSGGGGVVVVVVGRAAVEFRGADTGSVVAGLSVVLVVLVVVDGSVVIHVDAGSSAFGPSSTPSMYTPINTPVSADAATAKPLAAHSTRTACLRLLVVGATVERQNSTA